MKLNPESTERPATDMEFRLKDTELLLQDRTPRLKSMELPQQVMEMKTGSMLSRLSGMDHRWKSMPSLQDTDREELEEQ